MVTPAASKPPVNPDLAELIAYNKAGCDHPKVEHAVTKDRIAAIQAAGGIIGMNGFVAVFCKACGTLVPTDPPKVQP